MTNLKTDLSTLLVDCTGVGFGGLTEASSQVLLNLASLKSYKILVVTDNLELAIKVRHPNIKVKLFTRFRILNLMNSFLWILCIRLTKKSEYFLSFSPSLPSLAMGRHEGVQFVNDLQFLTQSHGIKYLYKRLILNLVIRNTKKIAVISDATRLRLDSYKQIKSQIRTIYLSGELKIKIETAPTPLYDFLVIGHSIHKRGEKFLEICRNNRMFNARIVFLQGQRHVDVQKFHELKNLTFRGAVSSDEYASLLANSRSLVMFSEPGTEGFGLPVAQALYLGRKTIISGDPALSEISMGSSRILDEEVDLITLEQLNLDSVENQMKWPLRDRTWLNVAADVNEYLSFENPERNRG